MGNVLDNSLFVRNPKKFQELSQAATQFNSLYNGNNIIQDDIFSVLTNYAKKNQTSLELLRFPTKDDDFCALTCVQKGKIFVYVNAWLPLSNQIFAAAHELYHIWCFIEKTDESVLRKGSFLSAAVIDEGVTSQEDQEANAFAGILLAPSNALHEQMQIYGISKERQSLEDIIQLMAIFSMPYKAVLLRLFEEQYIDERAVRNFLNIEKDRLKKAIGYEPDAYRWQRRTPEMIQMGNLNQLMEQNAEFDLLTDTRATGDQNTLRQILQKYKNI
ncbi:MAG: ImmA/IrrE family metallo-endopeptidase [Eubacteriales bacterium]|nr:ImmA/IrrE family metallo-endopeptidase [Eubacteriales bacterium]